MRVRNESQMPVYKLLGCFICTLLIIGRRESMPSVSAITCTTLWGMPVVCSHSPLITAGVALCALLFASGRSAGAWPRNRPTPLSASKKGVSKHDRNQLQESFAGFPQIVAGSRSLICTIASTGQKHCRNYAGVQSKLLVASRMGFEGTAEILAGQIRRETLFT